VPGGSAVGMARYRTASGRVWSRAQKRPRGMAPSGQRVAQRGAAALCWPWIDETVVKLWA